MLFLGGGKKKKNTHTYTAQMDVTYVNTHIQTDYDSLELRWISADWYIPIAWLSRHREKAKCGKEKEQSKEEE